MSDFPGVRRAAIPPSTEANLNRRPPFAITGHSSDDMARLYAGKAAQKARAREAQSARGKDDEG